MKDLKTVILSGAVQGLGRVAAYKFQKEGWRVVILDIQENPEMQRTGMKIYRCDLSHFEQTKDCLGSIFEEVGTVEALVNCVRYRRPKNLSQSPFEEWKKSLEIDLDTYFNTSSIVCEKMKGKGGKGCSIVNFSSVTSSLVTLKESISYHTAKAAITQMTRYLAVQYGPYNIRANTISPGLISREKTELSSSEAGASLYSRLACSIPLRRTGAPEEVAEAIFFLASPASSFITGHELTIDGGLCLCDQVGISTEHDRVPALC